MQAACLIEFAVIVIFVKLAFAKKQDPTLCWFGAVMVLCALFINVIFVVAGRV